MHRVMMFLALFAFVAAAGAAPIQIGLKYDTLKDSDPRLRAIYKTPLPLVFNPNPPPGSWRLPKPVGRTPLYASFQFGGTNRLAVLDHRRAEDVPINRLRIDLDGDANLSNDPAISFKGIEGGGMLMTDNIVLETVIGGKRVPSPVVFNGFQIGVSKLERRVADVRLHSRACCTGEFSVGSVKYRICIVDANVDGRFDSPPGKRVYDPYNIDRFVEPFCDLIFVDDATSSDTDGQPLGKWLVLGDTLYDVTFDWAASQMVLNAAEGKAVVSLPSSVSKLTLMRKNESEIITMVNPARKLGLPEGEWKVVSYQLDRADAHGDSWRYQARGCEDSAVFKFDRNHECACAIGEPLTPSADLSLDAKKQLNLKLLVLDPARTRMTSVVHQGTQTKIPLSSRKKDAPKEATWEVWTADRTQVASGKFEYG